MKKLSKGFTLVELLAVIVVLSIIMTIAGFSLSGVKNNINQKEIESVYNTIKKLGPEVYLKEQKTNVYYGQEYLKNNGYLKTDINNPSDGGQCDAYLIIKDNENDMFDAYVSCGGKFSKGDNDPTGDPNLKEVNDNLEDDNFETDN